MNRMIKSLFVILAPVTLVLLLNACGKEQSQQAADQTASPAMSEPATTTAAAEPQTDEQPQAAAGSESEAPSDTSTATETTAPPAEQAETATAAPSTAAPAAESVAAAPATGIEDMLALARKSGCLACHSVDKKLVGPAWKDVSARYKGNAEARAKLIEKVSKGGKGNWTDVVGDVAMPPYFPRVTRENIERLVDFVLSLANNS